MSFKRAVIWLALLLSTQTANAQVTIQVDYSPATLSEIVCSFSSTICDALAAPYLAASGTPYLAAYGSDSSTLFFELEESQRAVNNNTGLDPGYDVSSSLSGPLWNLYQYVAIENGSTLSRFKAKAIVQDGLVSDLHLEITYSFLLDSESFEYGINGWDGSFAYFHSTYNSTYTGAFNAFYSGTYDITQPPAITLVPEPETYAMLLAGLGLLGWHARRRKQKQAA